MPSLAGPNSGSRGEPDRPAGAGLSVLEYAPLAEITGRSPLLAPEAVNCSAPDTGNMEILHMFGTEEQKSRWLEPLLDGAIRSCISMTEPDVASSDPRNIRTRITRDGAHFVIRGRKWFSTGAASPRCKVAILMGVTDPDAHPYRRQSIVLHCMRAIGMAERAFDLMCARAKARHAFGSLLSDQGVIRNWIGDSRIRIEQARLLVLKTAWMIDTVGTREARVEISAIKVAVPRMARLVVDRAIQLFGAAGVSDEFPLAHLYAQVRSLQILDGPDEVHVEAVARRELARYEPSEVPPPYPF